VKSEYSNNEGLCSLDVTDREYQYDG